MITQNDLTSQLIEKIRKAAIDTAIEATMTACRIEQWHAGEITNYALLDDLARLENRDLWALIARIGNLDQAATIRLLEATAQERIDQAQDVISQAQQVIDEAQGGAA